jgi:ATP-dependent Clp protease protease subunit
MEINLREMLKLKKLYEIISEHSGQTYDWVEKASDRDYWMTSEEAKGYGMVDEVLQRSKDKNKFCKNNKKTHQLILVRFFMKFYD